jgi:hypothetical protein
VRVQLDAAVLKPANKFLPPATQAAWQNWWSDFTYKLRRDDHILLAEETDVGVLANHIGTWFLNYQ